MKAIKYIIQALHAYTNASPASSQQARSRQHATITRPQQHMQARSRQHATITDLPFPVIVQILAIVPVEHRLSSCAEVCTSWAAAAAAATIDPAVTQASFDADAVLALSAWLAKHASDVVSIRVPDVPFDSCSNLDNLHPLTLPCAQLARLEVLQLQGCKLQLNPSNSCSNTCSSSPRQGAVHADLDAAPLLLPAVRALYLTSCDLPVDSFAALQLPKLTALTLGHQPGVPGPVTDLTWKSIALRQQHCCVLSALLPGLPQLRYVNLTGLKGAVSMLVRLSDLQCLESCTLSSCSITDDCLSGLCSKLTALQLRACLNPPYRDTPDTPIPFRLAAVRAAGWPLLQQLCVTAMPLQPAAIAQLTALEVLQLTNCKLRPTERVPITSPFSAAAAGATELLATIAQLPLLRELCLDQIHLHAIHDHQIAIETYANPNPGVMVFFNVDHNNHLQPFSALTALDRLERLVLVYRDDDTEPLTKSQPVPMYSFKFMFPYDSRRKLLGLTELVLDSYGPKKDAWAFLGRPFDKEDLLEEEGGCLSDVDLQRLASCCPNLKRLTLNGVVKADWDLDDQDEYGDFAWHFRASQRRLQLTHLCLGGPWLIDDIAAVIASMTSLRSLQLHNAPLLTTRGLQRLTALRQLQDLRLDFVGGVPECHYWCEADTEAQEAEVWQQLAAMLSSNQRLQQEAEPAGQFE